MKCPAGCQDPKYHVYGTDVYSSYSSVCAAAVHRWAALNYLTTSNQGVGREPRCRLACFSNKNVPIELSILYFFWQPYPMELRRSSAWPWISFPSTLRKGPTSLYTLLRRGEEFSFMFMTRKPKAQDDVKHFLCFPVCAEQGNNRDVTKKGP